MKLDKFREFLANQDADTAAHTNNCSSSLANPKLSEYLVSYMLVPCDSNPLQYSGKKLPFYLHTTHFNIILLAKHMSSKQIIS